MQLSGNNSPWVSHISAHFVSKDTNYLYVPPRPHELFSMMSEQKVVLADRDIVSPSKIE